MWTLTFNQDIAFDSDVMWCDVMFINNKFGSKPTIILILSIHFKNIFNLLHLRMYLTYTQFHFDASWETKNCKENAQYYNGYSLAFSQGRPSKEYCTQVHGFTQLPPLRRSFLPSCIYLNWYFSLQRKSALYHGQLNGNHGK